MRELFIEKFKVPEVAYQDLDVFFTEEEMDFVENISKDVFNKEDIAKIIKSDADEFIKNEYHKGIISIDNEEEKTYCLCNFRRFLDIFVVINTEAYRTIEKDRRDKIELWYFDLFYNGLNPDPNVRPTSDEIMTLDEICNFIDSKDEPVFLSYCDCRSFHGDCKKPTKTCITYHTEINSFAHRGISEEIDKERAKEVVREADKAGLMHTANPGGICNCCGDCCYLFRGQERRGSRGFWPATKHIIAFDKEKCIGCGKCQRRCYFDVIEKDGRDISVNTNLCVGCGICATGCPVGALKIVDR